MRGLLFEGLDVSKHGGKRRPWVAVVSFGLHAAAFAVIVLLPLLSAGDPPVIADSPPMPKWPDAPRATLPPKPAPVRQQSQTPRVVTSAAPARSISVPIDVPDRIPTSTDVPPIDPGAIMVVGDPCPECAPALPGTHPGSGESLGTGVGTEPVRIVPGGNIQPPRKLKHVAPVYPAIAIAARVNATVVVECVIDVDGRVASARVVSGHPLLNEASIEAVERWLYQPTLLNGVPVAVQMTVTLRFSQVK